MKKFQYMGKKVLLDNKCDLVTKRATNSLAQVNSFEYLWNICESWIILNPLLKIFVLTYKKAFFD